MKSPAQIQASQADQPASVSGSMPRSKQQWSCVLQCEPGGAAHQHAPDHFNAWFGESKVVTTNGKPLVVYHGTAADFDSFDDAKTGANDGGLWGRGHYFSAVAENANSYALRQGDGARVIPAYVSIKHPLVLRTGSDLVTRLLDGTNYRELLGENLDGAKIKAIAVSGGHDGVIQFKRDGSIGDLVAFSATQIKFAIGNTCRFHQEKPDICMSTPHSASHNDHFIGICNADENAHAFELRERQRG